MSENYSQSVRLETVRGRELLHVEFLQKESGKLSLLRSVETRIVQGLGELSFVESRVWKSEPAAAFMACSSGAEEATTRGQNR